jgi:hypothetical protein
MGQSTDERLRRAIAAIDELIALVRETGLSQSGLFLDMAKLQLQLDLNGITDEEFGAFCDAIENRQLVFGTGERLAAAHARPRRNGDLRLMRRAWREPEDRTSQRGRARAGR